jgi:hypothetical protein
VTSEREQGTPYVGCLAAALLLLVALALAGGALALWALAEAAG